MSNNLKSRPEIVESKMQVDEEGKEYFLHPVTGQKTTRKEFVGQYFRVLDASPSVPQLPSKETV